MTDEEEAILIAAIRLAEQWMDRRNEATPNMRRLIDAVKKYQADTRNV